VVRLWVDDAKREKHAKMWNREAGEDQGEVGDEKLLEGAECGVDTRGVLSD